VSVPTVDGSTDVWGVLGAFVEPAFVFAVDEELFELSELPDGAGSGAGVGAVVVP
jgi:hypothetical protein